MPMPVSNNASVYDPSAQFSEATDCDPATATCPSSAVGSSPQPSPITLSPVEIVGDAGAHELIKRLDGAGSEPACAKEKYVAALTCVAAGATALGGVAAATTGLGAVAGFALTTTASAFCAKELSAFFDCKSQP